MTATETGNWGHRLQVRRAARIAAMVAEEQEIRDAVAADYPRTRIAEALGTKDRTRISAVVRSGRAGPIQQPALTPLVYLRGAGHKDDLWRAVEEAMWVRGWATTHDRTSAWHSARGGVPVVEVDFSVMHEPMTVARVTAKHCPDAPGFPGSAVAERISLVRRDGAHRVTDGPGLPDRLAVLVGGVLTD